MFRWGKDATRGKKTTEGANQLKKILWNKDNVKYLDRQSGISKQTLSKIGK